MKFLLYLLSLLFVPGCFGSYDSDSITMSPIELPVDINVIKLAKKNLFALIDNLQFKIDSKEAAETFFSYFILCHLKINDRDRFAEDLNKFANNYSHIKPLYDLLNSKINQNGKPISVKEFFRSNGLFFFINAICTELGSIVKKIEYNLIYFYPLLSLKLLKFMKPKPEYQFMDQGNLVLFQSSILDLIFQRSLRTEKFCELFILFGGKEQQTLMNTIIGIWGDSLIDNNFKIKNINDLRTPPGATLFFQDLLKEDFDINNVQINPAIRNLFGIKMFLDDLSLLDYFCKFGVFFTFANHYEHKILQKFHNLLMRNIKVIKFLKNLPLLRGLTDINGLGKVLFRYFTKSKPKMQNDIEIFRRLSIEDLNLLKNWESVIIEYSPEFPTIMTSFKDGEKDGEISLESIHYSLFGLSMEPLQRSLNLLASLIFDDIFFDRNFTEALQATVPKGATHFSKFLQMLGKSSKNFPHFTISEGAVYVLNEFFSSGVLKDHLLDRAKYFDRIEKDKNQISFEKRTKRLLAATSDYFKADRAFPKLLEILIKASVGKPISDEQLLFIMSLKGEVGPPLNYLVNTSDFEKLRGYLKDLENDPNELAFEIVADRFLTALSRPPLFGDIKEHRKFNPKTKFPLLEILNTEFYSKSLVLLSNTYSLNRFISERNELINVLLMAQKDLESQKLSQREKYLKYCIKPLIEFLKNRGGKFFGSEADRFGKFIDSLHLLNFLPEMSDIPNLLFKASFGLDIPVLGSKYPDNDIREQLSDWQKTFSGYNNDLTNAKANTKEMLLAIKEIRYTHFELELAKLTVKHMSKRDYSEVTFITEYQALCDEIKPEIEIDAKVEMVLKRYGILYAFAACKGDEFITRIINAVGVVAQKSLAINIVKRLVKYLENLEYLRWFINGDDTLLFTKLHNCLISIHSMGWPANLDQIQLISKLSAPDRMNLGIWQSHLVGFENGLGNFQVQDPISIREALDELGVVTLNHVLGKFTLQAKKILT